MKYTFIQFYPTYMIKKKIKYSNSYFKNISLLFITHWGYNALFHFDSFYIFYKDIVINTQLVVVNL